MYVYRLIKLYQFIAAVIKRGLRFLQGVNIVGIFFRTLYDRKWVDYGGLGISAGNECQIAIG